MFGKTFWIFVAICILTGIIYTLSFTGDGSAWNYFALLAQGFMQGHLYVNTHPAWLNELVNWQGKYYVVYPPMPAILLMPLVALFGTDLTQPLLSLLIGSLNVGLSYLVFLKIFKKQSHAIWLALLFGFGTMHWYHASVGSAWYIAHIIAVFFVWLVILEVLTKQRLFLIGLWIGLAYLSRLPTILMVVFPLVYLHRTFGLSWPLRLKIRPWILLSLGLAPGVIGNALYNYLRFGVINDISYQLLPIFNEPWYQNGLFSIKNIPTHLVEIFSALPKFQSTFPYVIPSINVLALWIVTPALVLMLFVRPKSRLFLASLMAILLVAIPGLMHGSNGFTQFGFRFAIDYLPFLIILVGLGVEKDFSYWKKALIVLSILVNLWGVYMISFLKITTL